MSGLFVPLAAVLPAGALLTVIARRVAPRLAVRLLGITVAACCLTVFLTSWLAALSVVAHQRISNRFLGWCLDAGSIGELHEHDHAPRWLSVAVVAIALWCAWRAVVVTRAWRRSRGVGASRVMVVESADLLAFAQTGRHGGIVISTALLARLDEDDRAVLFAHEQAHLDHRHDRFLAIAALGASIPPLLPAVRELRLAVERWADELAAMHTGGRERVARVIAQAALARHDATRLTPSISGADLPARIDALLAPPAANRRPALWNGVAAVASALAVGGSAVQVHHVFGVLERLCPW